MVLADLPVGKKGGSKMEETKKFEAEVQQLLHLVINSLYSNKDIFLRELIANAADAIDKVRFESLTRPEMASEWEISIEADKKNKILKISDNGVGMTKGEVIRDIGTIAKSGTKAYIESIKDQKVTDIPELIGQFGVGFYSAFMVAEKIVLISKRAGSDEAGVRWESKGETEYVVDETSKEGHGTDIYLHLKPEFQSYLEDWRIREIVKKYSDFIEFPIRFASKEKKSDGSESLDFEVLNSGKALWLKPASAISEEEYEKFYSHLVHYDKEPAARIHYSAEGSIEFKALLFIPSKAPFDLFMPDTGRKGVQLYIRRVFITDESNILLPEYLRFVKGVVESNDLPLNVSREILQDSPQISKIQKNLVKKILGELKKLFENNLEKYMKFYGEFKNTLKEGVHSDYVNKDAITDLLLFESIKSQTGKMISLKQYCSEMVPSQNEIYCFLGESRNSMENSPHLEFFKTNGIDVLLMTDAIDEWIINDISEYSGKKIKIVGKSEINFSSITSEGIRKEVEESNKKHSKFLVCLSAMLEKNVKQVRFSPAVTESPCCITMDESAPGLHMEKLMKAMNKPMPETKNILDLNPGHSLIKALCAIYEKSPEDARIKEYVELLYDQALLADGKPVRDMSQFSRRMTELMSASIDIFSEKE